MNFLELAEKRYSVRDYADKNVEEEKLKKILAAAHAAPTAANLQPVRLLVLQTKEQLAKLEKSANIYHAPLAIVVCSDTEKAWTRPYDGKQTTDIDASIVTDHMMLEATDLDLGSVWIGIFKPDVIKEEFHLPAHLEPISILAIGYVKSSPANLHDHLATRLSLDELVLKIF